MMEDASYRGEAWSKRARNSARRFKTTLLLFLSATAVILLLSLFLTVSQFTWKSWFTIELTLVV